VQALFRTRHETERLEATILELQTALEQGWQRREALERERDQLRAEVAVLRAAATEAPRALAAERESLRRQIDDLLTVKLRMSDELRGVLDLLADGHGGADAAAQAGGRAYGDLGALLEGTIELVVEPIRDFDAISAVERALARVPQVEAVRPRTADGVRVVFEVELRAPGPLLRALDGQLPFDADATVEDGTVVMRVRAAS
jgi:ABC-type transporter Mla subunit MlaD